MRASFPSLASVLSLTSVLALSCAVGACATEPTGQPSPQPADQANAVSEPASDNPLLRPSELPYGAPNYDAIELAHYLPAFEASMSAHLAEVAAVANSDEDPSFENTIVALERTGRDLNRVSEVFGSLTGTVSTPEIQAIEAEMAPRFSDHYDTISLDPALFARVSAVYDNRESLSGENLRLVEETYKRFVRAGAKLDDAAKVRIREINGELSSLTTKFGQNLLDVTSKNAVVVEDKAELAGLSESEIANLAAAAKAVGKDGKYLISLLNTTRQPILTSLENRDLRKRVWEASAYRGVAENGPIIQRVVALRAEKAKLLGYETWAHYVLDGQMAKTPAAVLKILDDLAPKAAAKAKAEAKEVQKAIKRDKQKFKLEPWDWAYYAEKVRQKKYSIDEAEVRAYFELDRVLQDGVFFAMNELFGITFKERDDLPTYHPDVRTFEVFNEDGSSIGLFYADYFAREGKRGGAWMNAIVPQTGLFEQKPVIVNCLNIAKPAEGEPALISFDEAQTMFHEMGHGVHGLFSQATYPSLAGTSVARDYVEFPSQFEEDWLIDPKVLTNVAKHYETGEPMPKELLDKVLAAGKFNQGFNSLEYLGAALLDMEWHLSAPGAELGEVQAFESAALAKHGVDYGPVPPRYKSTYFSHVFAGGYSAGYYAYLWTEVLAADAFAYMGTQGGLTRANGDKFRDLILSRGNTIEPMKQYVSYRGQEPTVDAVLVRRGLE